MDFAKTTLYPIVQLSAPYEDARGTIQNLFTEGMQSGALITSKAGTRRADHYHKTGNHLCLLLSGVLIYRWRPVGKNTKPNALTITPGLAFFSPPMVEHSMEFVVDSTFLSFDSKVTRDHEGYENDLVRLAEPLR